MSKRTEDRRLLPSLAGAALARYMKFVYATSRKLSNVADLDAEIRARQPFIYAVWHGQFMMGPTTKPKDVPTKIMVARHGDAEFIGEALIRLDIELIRGAGAGDRGRDRGGAQALRAAIRALAADYVLVMTADVPPGPARKAGMGIITLARMSGRPIIPVATASSRYWALKTWSRFTINLPFSKLATVFCEPVSVPRDASPEEQERLRVKVEEALNEATAKAYSMAGADPARATPPGGTMAGRTMAGGTTAGGPMAPAAGTGPLGASLSTYARMTSLARPLAPMILKARERRGKEDGTRRPERLGIASAPRPDGTVIWIHAASVGELNAAVPVIGALGARFADLSYVVTTGTVTSARLAAKRLPARAIHQYVPLDAPEYVGRFLDYWRPDLAVFVESEIWPNLILESARRQIPLALVNARMSPKSFTKWRRSATMAGALFGRFASVLAQNRKMARRFSDLGAANVRSVGNLKVDAPPPPVDDAALAEIRGEIGARPVLIAASTHIGEDEIVAQAHKILAGRIDGLLTIIAPRHPERGAAIAQMVQAQSLKVARRSLGEPPTADVDIYLADTIGELGMLFALAPVAFIGGSLVPRGGQNPIEAIRHGAAVLTGPHWNNFRDEYKSLKRAGAVSEVATAEELAREVAILLCDDAERARRRQRASDALGKLTGALTRTVDALAELLPERAVEKPQKDLRRAS